MSPIPKITMPVPAGAATAKVGSPGTVASIAAEVLADGPLLYWELQEASGLPQDATANNLDATATVGTPDYHQAGPAGGWSIGFTDAEQFTRAIPTASFWDFTFAFWVYLAPIVDDVVVFNNGDGGTGWGVAINGDGTFKFHASGLVFGPASANAIPAATWTHIAMTDTVGSGDVDYYFNGSLDTSVGAVPINVPSGDLYLNGLSPRDGITGRIAHFAIFESVLSSGRIAAHYAAAAGSGPVVVIT